MFTGRDRDPDTGLYNLRHRNYSPGLGRFVQPDPIGVRGRDVNLYRHTKNNPINLCDPFGLSWGSIVGHFVIGAAVGAIVAGVVAVAAPVVAGALVSWGGFCSTGNRRSGFAWSSGRDLWYI